MYKKIFIKDKWLQYNKDHPWVHKKYIAGCENGVMPGDIVSVYSKNDKFIGVGYYNPASLISIRLFTRCDEEINTAFFVSRIKAALDKRKEIQSITNAYRVIFSEADGVPGFIADCYDNTIVFQSLTLGIEKCKMMIVDALREVCKPDYIYERSDTSARKIEGLEPVVMWHGTAGSTKIKIKEGAANFFVDIEHGHKTAFYLDQRKARLAIGEFVKGKTLLDVCCYTGGFCVQAALAGASSIIGADIKNDWLQLANENARLNGVENKIKFVKQDVFETFEKLQISGEKYDVIILDPPSFVKSKEKVASALTGYEKLNTMAMKSINKGGILCTFSCSHNISGDMFAGIIKNAAQKSGRTYTILKRCHQDKDHPIVKSIPETAYLRGYFLKLI